MAESGSSDSVGVHELQSEGRNSLRLSSPEFAGAREGNVHGRTGFLSCSQYSRSELVLIHVIESSFWR